MKQPSKLHRGPGECIGASRALCIDKPGHAPLILFCYSAVRRNEGPRFVFPVAQPTSARFFFSLYEYVWIYENGAKEL